MVLGIWKGRGDVYSFGKNNYGQLGIESCDAQRQPVRIFSDPLSREHVLRVSCGYFHTVAVSDDGKVYTFGRNDYGQLGLGTTERVSLPTVTMQINKIYPILCGQFCKLCLLL